MILENIHQLEDVFSYFLSGEVLGLVLRGHLDPTLAAEITERIQQRGDRRFFDKKSVRAKITKSLFECQSLQEYLELAAKNPETKQGLFPNGEDPMKAIVEWIRAFLVKKGKTLTFLDGTTNVQNVGMIRETFRSTESNPERNPFPPHDDLMPYKEKFPEIFENLETIYSIVIVFSTQNIGGQNIIYDRRPTWDDYNNPKYRDRYGWAPAFYQGAPKVEIKAGVGDVLFLCADRPHTFEAVPTEGPPRLTEHCFFGRLKSGNHIVWN